MKVEISGTRQPTLQKIAERQGLTFVEGAGIYSETGDLLLQLHPDLSGIANTLTAYAIPEVVEWEPVHSKDDADGLYTWATVFTNPPGAIYPFLHYFTVLDPRKDAAQTDIDRWDEVPDLRELVASWRAQAEEKQDG